MVNLKALYLVHYFSQYSSVRQNRLLLQHECSLLCRWQSTLYCNTSYWLLHALLCLLAVKSSLKKILLFSHIDEAEMLCFPGLIRKTPAFNTLIWLLIHTRANFLSFSAIFNKHHDLFSIQRPASRTKRNLQSAVPWSSHLFKQRLLGALLADCLSLEELGLLQLQFVPHVSALHLSHCGNHPFLRSKQTVFGRQAVFGLGDRVASGV